jgi:hypothetical protein
MAGQPWGILSILLNLLMILLWHLNCIHNGKLGELSESLARESGGLMFKKVIMTGTNKLATSLAFIMALVLLAPGLLGLAGLRRRRCRQES